MRLNYYFVQKNSLGGDMHFHDRLLFFMAYLLLISVTLITLHRRPKRQQRGTLSTMWHWLPRGQTEWERRRPDSLEDTEDDDDDDDEQL